MKNINVCSMSLLIFSISIPWNSCKLNVSLKALHLHNWESSKNKRVITYSDVLETPNESHIMTCFYHHFLPSYNSEIKKCVCCELTSLIREVNVSRNKEKLKKRQRLPSTTKTPKPRNQYFCNKNLTPKSNFFVFCQCRASTGKALPKNEKRRLFSKFRKSNLIITSLKNYPNWTGPPSYRLECPTLGG